MQYQVLMQYQVRHVCVHLPSSKAAKGSCIVSFDILQLAIQSPHTKCVNAQAVHAQLACAPAGDFDSFAALIKATRERDAARKAKQPSSMAQPGAADARPSTAADVKPVVSTSDGDSHPEDTAQADAAMNDALHQHEGAEKGSASISRDDPAGAMAAYPAGVAADQHQAAAEACNGLDCRDPGLNAQCAQRLHSDRQVPAAEPSLEHNERHLPHQQAQPTADDRVDLTLDDHMSHDSLQFDVNVDIDDEDISSAQPAALHGRALQRLHLPNTQAGAHSNGHLQRQHVRSKIGNAQPVMLKADMNSVWNGHQQTADALDNLDTVIADSDPD